MKSAEKIRVAQDVAESVFSRQDVLGVLLVGSLARGRACAGSDIDIVILSTGDSPGVFSQERVQGNSVDLHEYGVAHFPSEDTPSLDLRRLREFARIGNGRVLQSRWDELDTLRARAVNAVLSPLDASVLMNRFEEGVLAALRPDASESARVAGAHSAALSVSILALSNTPTRYHKPKWLLRDLATAGFERLAEVVSTLLTGAETSEPALRQAHTSCRTSVESACVSLGLPPLTRDADAPYEYTYVCRTLADADALLGSGAVLEAAAVSALALRFTEGLFHTVPNDLDAEAWREATVCAAISGPARLACMSEDHVFSLVDCADLVAADYGAQFSASAEVR